MANSSNSEREDGIMWMRGLKYTKMVEFVSENEGISSVVVES
jgi:hypothetical protein